MPDIAAVLDKLEEIRSLYDARQAIRNEASDANSEVDKRFEPAARAFMNREKSPRAEDICAPGNVYLGEVSVGWSGDKFVLEYSTHTVVELRGEAHVEIQHPGFDRHPRWNYADERSDVSGYPMSDSAKILYSDFARDLGALDYLPLNRDNPLLSADTMFAHDLASMIVNGQDPIHDVIAKINNKLDENRARTASAKSELKSVLTEFPMPKTFRADVISDIRYLVDAWKPGDIVSRDHEIVIDLRANPIDKLFHFMGRYGDNVSYEILSAILRLKPHRTH